MPDGPAHKNQTGANLHVPGYQQSGDPGAVGAGKFWVDTTGGTGAWALKSRNAADSGWETIATAGTGLTAGSQADMETASSNTVGVTPGRLIYSPSAVKAWVLFNGSGTPAVIAGLGVASITDHAVGEWTINLSPGFSSADYSGVGNCGVNANLGGVFLEGPSKGNTSASANAKTATTWRCGCVNASGSLIDADWVDVHFTGDYA